MRKSIFLPYLLLRALMKSRDMCSDNGLLVGIWMRNREILSVSLSSALCTNRRRENVVSYQVRLIEHRSTMSPVCVEIRHFSCVHV